MNNSQQASRVPKSMQLYERARLLIPGATQLVSRRPTRLAFGVSPVYAARAKGSRFWDVDGHEYIDWVSGIGAIILGYADPIVDDAVQEQIATGIGFSVNHELEIELAEALVDTIPCAEMVRFCKGGGEACAIAVRIARGVTGRDKILFRGYHGWHDWYLAANLSTEASLDNHLFPGIEPIGVPRCLEGSSIPFPYGDLNALGEVFDAHRGEIAAVIMEPLRSEMPPEGYLAGVKKLTEEHNTILIFDEVSTGFRPTAQGVQPLVGVVPNMAVFAKSISNGYPMGAVVGSREVMQPAANMFISSTYWSDTIGLRAALTTLRETRRRDVPSTIKAIGTQLQTRITGAASEVGLAASCEGVAFHPQLRFQTDNFEQQSQLTTLYIQEMAKRGCHGYASFYLNAAQNSVDIDQTVAAAKETFEIMANGIHDNRIDDLLECEVITDSFQRLVR